MQEECLHEDRGKMRRLCHRTAYHAGNVSM